MIFVKTLCIALLVAPPFITVECRSYNNGLIFYNLENHNTYLPPTISVSRGRGLAKFKYSPRGSIWSTFGKPCHCDGPLCGCCVGMQVKQYNFDQKICANVSYVLPKDEIQLEVILNDTATAKYGITARNPSPLCVPIMMGIPMSMCIQMSNIGVQGDNLNMCMDFLVRLASTEIFEMHFQCMKVGLQGASWVGSDGQPVIPANEGKIKDKSANQSDDYYDESEAEEENEIISKEKCEESIDVSMQEEDLNKAEEEMDYNNITEKIRDIVKEQDQGILKENEENNQMVNDNKQLEAIVTNIMDSITEDKTAEDRDILRPGNVGNNNSAMHNSQESAVFEDNEKSAENTESLEVEVNKVGNVEKNIVTNVSVENESLEEPLQNKLESVKQDVTNITEGEINHLGMENFDHQIIKNSQNSETLLNTAMKDEFYLEDLFENSQEKETQMENNAPDAIKITNQNSEKFQKKPETIETTYQETPEYILKTEYIYDELGSTTTNKFDMLINKNDTKETTDFSKNDSELNDSFDMLEKTSEISTINVKDNAVIMTTKTATTTTKNKPMQSDKATDVAKTSIESTNDIDRNNNENDDQDRDNESNDGDNSDGSDGDNTHENDSDYEDKESEEMENEIELNKATTIDVPTGVEFNNKNDSSHKESLTKHELPYESNSSESYSNGESEENAKDIFEIENMEFEEYSDQKYQNLSDEHYEDFSVEEEKGGDNKDYVTRNLSIGFKEINTTSNTCCKPDMFNNSHVTTTQQLNDNNNNNNSDILQIDNATSNNLQFISNSNSLINKTDDDNMLNMESTTNKISQIIATSTSTAATIATSTANTSSNVMPLPLARRLYALQHQHQLRQQQQQPQQQNHRQSRQRQQYV